MRKIQKEWKWLKDTKGSGQEGVNLSWAGLGLRGKWYWKEEARGTLCSCPRVF